MKEHIITDKAIASKLPHAGPMQFHIHWFVLKWWWQSVRLKNWWSVRYYMSPQRTRMANCVSLRWGVFELLLPRPWLAGPARVLHPEAFGGL